jgi:hypothetical protein
MLRTLLAFFNPDATACTAAPRTRVAAQPLRNRLRLHWTTRDGRLVSRWHHESGGLAEDDARMTGCPAA